MPRRTHAPDKKHAKRRRRDFREFLDEERISKCPRPDKHRFETQEQAELFINDLYARSAREYGRHYLPERTYKCACGWWHVTSRELR